MIIQVYRHEMQYVKDYTFFTALRQCWTVPSFQKEIWLYDSATNVNI